MWTWGVVRRWNVATALTDAESEGWRGPKADFQGSGLSIRVNGGAI